MANKGIDFVLSLNATRFQRGLEAVSSKTKAAGAAIDRYWQQTSTGASKAASAFGSMQTKILGAVAAIGGVYAVKSGLDSVTDAALAADKASFNLSTSISAANREFKVGDAGSWQKNIAALNAELKIYSTQTIEAAASKTIDMTKRLGLSEQQMVKVIRASANLGAGKFELSDSVERVTAALRGEAEASEALGLTLSESYVKSWYEASGATKGAWKDLTDMQKAQVRYGVLLQQSDPLQGKAAASAKLYFGAIEQLGGSFDKIKKSLGRVKTENSFFVEGINKIDAIVKQLDGDVEANKGKWMEWSKQASLAVLDFGIGTLKVTNSVYSGFEGVVGGIKQMISWFYQAKANALEWDAVITKIKNPLDIGTGAGQYDKIKAEAAAARAEMESFKASAQQSFAEMGQGSTKIQAAANGLQQFRDQMAQVAATEIIPAGKTEQQAKKVEQEIIRVGDKWVGVAKQVNDTPITLSLDEASAELSKPLQDFAAAGKEQAAVIEEVNKDAAHGVSGSWDDAAESFADSWDRVIKSIASRLDSLRAKATSTSSSGSSGSYASGGLVGGWSPHSRADNINAWLTAKEFVQPVPSVKKYGVQFMEAVRRGTFPVDLALAGIGGRISSMIAGVPSGNHLASGGVAAASPGYSSSYVFTDQSGYTGRVHGAEVDIRALERAITKSNRYRSRN